MKQSVRMEYIKYRLEKSEETLEVAELLIENKKWNSAVNRLYYSAFYAISALLLQTDIHPKSHFGLKSKFFQEYIKTEVINPELGKAYTLLFNWRLKTDYGDFIDFTKEDVLSILSPSKEWIHAVRHEIESQ